MERFHKEIMEMVRFEQRLERSEEIATRYLEEELSRERKQPEEKPQDTYISEES